MGTSGNKFFNRAFCLWRCVEIFGFRSAWIMSAVLGASCRWNPMIFLVRISNITFWECSIRSDTMWGTTCTRELAITSRKLRCRANNSQTVLWSFVLINYTSLTYSFSGGNWFNDPVRLSWKTYNEDMKDTLDNYPLLDPLLLMFFQVHIILVHRWNLQVCLQLLSAGELTISFTKECFIESSRCKFTWT